MNDTIRKIREFIRSNSDGDPQKFISFFSFLLFGDGGSNTLNEDIRILKSKAENGDPETQYCLGFCYENGIGVPKDKAEAVSWHPKPRSRDTPQHKVALGFTTNVATVFPKTTPKPQTGSARPRTREMPTHSGDLVNVTLTPPAFPKTTRKP